MSEFEERKLGELTVRIDRLLCVGFGDCIEVALEAFEFDDEGIATFTSGFDDLGDGIREELLEACERCPVDALVVLDGDGRQLVP